MKKVVFFSIGIIVLIITGLLTYGNGGSDASNHIYSHRGASGEEIEHTFLAYDLAIEYGSKFIEQDLVTSKEGTLYVSHDNSAKRLANENKNFNQLMDTEIDQLRVSNGEKVHTLAAIFDRYEDKVTYVIELKNGESQVQSFEKIVNDYGLVENIIVQSFDKNALIALEKIFPKMERLYLVKNQEELENAINYDYVDILSINKELMTNGNVELIKKNDKKINVWTLNTVDEIKHAIKLNVDTYFTDYTAKALLLEKKYRR